MSDKVNLVDLGVGQSKIAAAEKMAEAFNALTKDMPEVAKAALAGVVVGATVAVGAIVAAKKL
ncbi:hypothetical protein [Azospirillum argentinense]|uniref:hypothetical protein n=1 Tax=Azospirillum argentinense TaxID=2970906 RepID=UPI0032DFD456